jgi:hypothetical protein
VESEAHDQVYEEIEALAFAIRLEITRNPDVNPWEIIDRAIVDFPPNRQRSLVGIMTCMESIMPKKTQGADVEVRGANGDVVKGKNLQHETAKVLLERGTVTRTKSGGTASGNLTGDKMAEVAAALGPVAKTSLLTKFKEALVAAPVTVIGAIIGGVTIAVIVAYLVPKMLGPAPTASQQTAMAAPPLAASAPVLQVVSASTATPTLAASAVATTSSSARVPPRR